MAGIHQTLRDVRSLFADVVKLHQEVLACHCKQQGSIQQMQEMQQQIRVAYQELGELIAQEKKRLERAILRSTDV